MKTPFVTKEQMEAIVREYPTPFHIYDERGIRENARRLRAAFAWNPGYREYFAVKATPTPGILKILREEGCGCDCSSLSELLLAQRCGITGEQIMFSSNDTPAAEFRKAAELGAVINLDDLTLVDFLQESVGRVPEKICCRYNPGGVFTLGETREGFQVMDNPGDAKYGMTRPQLAEAFRRLHAMGAKEFGIHAFLASNTLSNDYYPELARILFQLAADLKAETGVHDHLHQPLRRRGHPLPAGADRPTTSPSSARACAGPRGDPHPRRHGRRRPVYGAGPVHAGALRPPGHHRHPRKAHLQGVHRVDACACNLMRPAMYGAYHHITVLGKENAPCDHKYDVVGSLCENNDKFAVDRMLPKIDRGDLLVIHDTGAHGFSMGYNYNGKLRSAELLLRQDGSVKLLRRAETVEDYFATLCWD
jgi:diaminopimelate decarboxylase